MTSQGGVTLIGLLAKRKYRDKLNVHSTVVETLRFAAWLASLAGGYAH